MENRIAIVTGGAKGIGKEMVKTLAKKGIKVIANYCHSEKEAYELKQELEKELIKIDIIQADVSQNTQCQKIIDFALEKYHKIDILINNAGISQIKLMTEVKQEDWNKIINTNLYSAFAMCQKVLPSMIQQQKGCIINISSIWGIVGSSMETVYSIAKAGMDGLTKSLAKEVGPSNIRVNSIAPGLIDTDMNQDFTQQELKEIQDKIPLGKMGKPEDIAKCAMWLIEDQYMTGQIISPNGGWIIG